MRKLKKRICIDFSLEVATWTHVAGGGVYMALGFCGSLHNGCASITHAMFILGFVSLSLENYSSQV